MKYDLQQGKLKIQSLINSNKISKALKISSSLAKKHHDTELLLTHIQLQLLDNDIKGCEITRKHINKLHPNNLSLHKQLASVFKNNGHYNMAIAEYVIAIELTLNDEALYNDLASLYIHTLQYNNAITLLKTAIEYFPNSSLFNLMLGACYQSLQDIDSAFIYYERSQMLNSNNYDAVVGIANIHYIRKKYGTAIDILQPVIDSNTCPFSALILYSQLASATNNHDRSIKILEAVPDNSVSPLQQSMKYFSLGRLNDEIRNFDIAFHHYAKANKLAQSNYDRLSYENYFASISANFTRDAIDLRKRNAMDSKRLVFIVGMPRSGTSLVEQILASHPDVYGCGELNTLGEIVKQIYSSNKLESGNLNFIRKLDDNIIENSALKYISHVDSINKESQIITDKMPDNFQYLGMINILFPHAKIIHCTRNPIDTCLSCYFQQFSGHYPYAYSLDNLAHYYSSYKALMLHWQQHLSIPIFEINYETLIEDKENSIRKLLEYCRLSWDENCLEFNKSNRAVTTASTHQVSKALYKSSAGRWRNYEPHIGELIDQLK